MKTKPRPARLSICLADNPETLCNLAAQWGDNIEISFDIVRNKKTPAKALNILEDYSFAAERDLNIETHWVYKIQELICNHPNYIERNKHRRKPWLDSNQY